MTTWLLPLSSGLGPTINCTIGAPEPTTCRLRLTLVELPPWTLSTSIT